MKKIACLGLMAMGVLLAGCVGTIHLTPTQGLAIAEAGADGINHTAVVVAPTLHGANANKAKGVVDTVNNALDAAYVAKKQGIAGFPAAVTAALKAIATAQTTLK